MFMRDYKFLSLFKLILFDRIYHTCVKFNILVRSVFSFFIAVGFIFYVQTFIIHPFIGWW